MIEDAPNPDDARCRRCGYLLRGLDDSVCPECGTGFDRADAATFVTGLTVVGHRHLANAMAGAVVTIFSPAFSTIGEIVYLCLLGLGYLTEVVVAAWCVYSLISLRGSPIKKGRLIMALVVAMGIVVGCPGGGAAFFYVFGGV